MSRWKIFRKLFNIYRKKHYNSTYKLQKLQKETESIISEIMKLKGPLVNILGNVQTRCLTMIKKKSPFYA